MFGHMPGQARWACDALFALGLYSAVVAIAVVLFDAEDGELLHTFQWFILSAMLGLSLAAWVVCALLAFRVRMAWWLAWPIGAVYALNMPLGTGGAVFLFFGLISDDMKQFLDPSATPPR
jgi:hypothetical protein